MSSALKRWWGSYAAWQQDTPRHCATVASHFDLFLKNVYLFFKIKCLQYWYRNGMYHLIFFMTHFISGFCLQMILLDPLKTWERCCRLNAEPQLSFSFYPYFSLVNVHYLIFNSDLTPPLAAQCFVSHREVLDELLDPLRPGDIHCQSSRSAAEGGFVWRITSLCHREVIHDVRRFSSQRKR